MSGFACGDRVVYGSHGVCTVVGIEKKRIDRRPVEYYVLQPVDGSSSCYYVPTQNQSAVSKLRALLTKAQVEELLNSSSVRQTVWVEDENLRKQCYKELIVGGDRSALLAMVHSIYVHKEAQETAGKRLHLCDENFLHDAQKLLESELSLVLDIPDTDVANYIKNAFE